MPREEFRDNAIHALVVAGALLALVGLAPVGAWAALFLLLAALVSAFRLGLARRPAAGLAASAAAPVHQVTAEPAGGHGSGAAGGPGFDWPDKPRRPGAASHPPTMADPGPRAGSRPGHRAAAARRSPSATVALSAAAGDAAGNGCPPPLVFGGGSRAHGAPWLLPRRPAQPGVTADDATLGGLGVLAASVVGPDHRCAEPAKARQDAYRIARDDSGAHLVVAVADGISACRYSDLGAQIAVTTAVNLLVEELREGGDPRLVDEFRLYREVAERMRATAAGRGLAEREIGVVMIVAVIAAEPEADGDRTLWLSWLGDVSAWQLTGGERWEWLAGEGKSGTGSMLQEQEIHAALPWAPDAVRREVFRLPAGVRLAFLTDGVGDPLAGSPEFNAHLARSWARKPSLMSFLHDMDFDARTYLDDRTAVVVWTGP
ncbi:protein phosphatase 2C domain-containing protein [Streptomyces aidingensis]|uniref:Protein phosphatase 2C n=1 Tax=Streptomyces aidingensis TaxID=910347 RepID=A0A1I1ECX8_9ACTN|nr:protein phosphatase 2C domain-containing protein [Streptomyces aidingensis]SFB84616.1 Protein phosphatase 2C [Streptomyces aidingensis]